MTFKPPVARTALLLLVISAGTPIWAADAEGEPRPVTQTEVLADAPGSVAPARVEPVSYRPLSGKERWNLYVRDTFWSPGAFFRAAGPALGGHLSNEPPEWRQGTAGYSRRFANRFGRFTLQKSYEAAGAALLQHEVRYRRSDRYGFLPRASHALTANFATYDASGRRAPHLARVGAAFAAEFTGNLWVPAGHRDTATALRGVVTQLGVSSAFNLVREFAPELRRMFFWK